MEFTIDQILEEGIAAHEAGQLHEAERLYRSILKSHPAHPEANHNLGVLAISINEVKDALQLFKTALEANSKNEQFWQSYIDALIQDQQIGKARQVLKQARKQGVDADSLNSLERKLSQKTQKPDPANPGPPEELLNSLLWHYQNGRFSDAERLSLEITKDFPENQFAWKVLGAVLVATSRSSEAVNANRTAVTLSPQDAEAYRNLGISLQALERLDEAEASYMQAIKLKSDYAEAHFNLGIILKGLSRLNESEASYKKAIVSMPDYFDAHYNLGILLQEQGRLEEAQTSYTQAIALKPDCADAHNYLGHTLSEMGRLEEALASYAQAIALKPDFPEAHNNSGFTLFEKGDYVGALNCFQQSRDLKRGHKVFDDHHQETPVEISKSKIDHDIEQFEYLASRSIEKDYFSKLVTEYKKIKSETSWASESGLTKVNPAFLTTLANSRKLLYQAEAGRVNQAINSSLDTNSIYERYFSHESGLTYIDEFLGSEALESLRTFLLESTIWFKEKKGGYLGAYLGEGLASPLLLQIASELQSRFPLIIKDHPLNHVWAYKYDSRASDPVSDVTGINIHADFAAVNVNFWITQSEANLDPNSGGMVVYNTEAPKDWSFAMYNTNLSRIQEELNKSNGGREVIPHRENRMVIFNSNLFHETDKYYFKEGYENRRINVTMLFGRREDNY